MWKGRLLKICMLPIPLFKDEMFLSFSKRVFLKIFQNVLNDIFTEF